MNTPTPYLNVHDFEKDLLDHSNNPPGNDPVLKAFYSYLLTNFKSKKNLFNLTKKVAEKRPEVTNQHLINLLYRAFQFIKFSQKDLNYRNFTLESQWNNELEKIWHDQALSDWFFELLCTKSTNTTIFQRYLGPFSLIKYLYPSPVSVLDVGCGGNYGLRGINIADFDALDDLTPQQFVFKSINHKVKFNKAVALDREIPDDEAVYEWRLACSFYPQELDKLEKIVLFENKISKSKAVEFIKSDFLTSNIKEKFDAIIFCVMLYQQSPKIREAFFEKAKTLLKPNGIIIVQDFAKKTNQKGEKLDFNASWFGEKFAHKTYVYSPLTNWKFWEVLKWNNGRCQTVQAGEDFNNFLLLKKRRKHSFSIGNLSQIVRGFLN